MADESGSKILRFSSDTGSPKHQESSGKKYQATAKYDRKALKKRLEVEEWLHYELRRLFNCEVVIHFTFLIFDLFFELH